MKRSLQKAWLQPKRHVWFQGWFYRTPSSHRSSTTSHWSFLWCSRSSSLPSLPTWFGYRPIISCSTRLPTPDLASKGKRSPPKQHLRSHRWKSKRIVTLRTMNTWPLALCVHTGKISLTVHKAALVEEASAAQRTIANQIGSCVSTCGIHRLTRPSNLSTAVPALAELWVQNNPVMENPSNKVWPILMPRGRCSTMALRRITPTPIPIAALCIIQQCRWCKR